MSVFEYVFGSKKYAITVDVMGVPVPMGLYDRFVPNRFKQFLERRELQKRRRNRR